MKKILLSCAAAGPLLLPAIAAASGNNQVGARVDDEIIVTAPYPWDERTPSVGTAVVTQEELLRENDGTLGGTIRKVPGVSAATFGAGASRPVIRGQSGNRVRVLDNGITSIDASSSSPDHAVAATPALAERIEIQKGASLLRYGSTASGGVIDVQDGRLPEEVPVGGLTGAVRVGGSSVDDGYDAAIGLTGLLYERNGTALVGHVSGSRREADNYEIPGRAEAEIDRDEPFEPREVRFGILGNSFSDSTEGAAGLSLIRGADRLAIAVKSVEAVYGIPGGHGHGHEEAHEEEHEVHEEEEEEGDVFIDLNQTRIDLHAHKEFDNDYIEAFQVFAGLADYRHIEFEGPGEPGTTFTNEGGEIRAELISQRIGAFRAALGTQYRHRDYAAIGDEAFVPPTTTDEVAVYLFTEAEFGRTRLESSIRQERTSHEETTAGIDREFDATSVSLGAGYTIGQPGERIGVTVFRTERAPATEELYSNGPHLATDSFEIGDPGFGIETALGVEGSFAFGPITLNGFYTDYDDFIFERPTDAFEDDLQIFRFEARDVRFVGGEAVLSQPLGAVGPVAFVGSVAADYVNAEDEDGRPLPFIPPLRVLGSVAATHRLWEARLEVEHARPQNNAVDYEFATEEFTLIDLFFTRELAGGLVLRTALRNVADNEARLAASPLKEDVPLPGRNAELSLRYAF